MDVPDKDRYLKARQEAIQNNIVNCRSALSSSTESSEWIFRTTGCDVVSHIMTTVPIRSGQMKDIRPVNKELRRIKPPPKRIPGKVNPGNPLQTGDDMDEEVARMRNNAKLKKEKRHFMKKLHDSRHIRSTVENNACILIQKYYRGRYCRKHMEAIKTECILRKEAYTKAMEIANTIPNIKIIKTGKEFRESYLSYRFRNAIIIQCTFRRYISRRVLRRKALEMAQDKRMRAVTLIQCMARFVSGRAKSDLARVRYNMNKQRKNAIIIQRQVRALFARRRVRRRRLQLKWIAAGMIQGWYRYKKAKIKSTRIKEIVQAQKLFLGAQGMQCLVRRKIARSRVNRMRLRRLYLYLFEKVCRIQTLVRQFVGKCRVNNKRIMKRADTSKKSLKWVDQQSESAQDLAASAEDIFYQSAQGNLDIVERLFNTDPDHSISEVNGKGESILHIAAINGHLDIVQKCFEWDFDFNTRTKHGATPLMLAVQNNKLSVVQYILVPPVKFKLDRFSAQDAAFLLVKSLENVNENLLYARKNKSNGTDVYDTESTGIASNMVDLLLQQSLPVTGKTMSNGITPLHAAASAGKLEAFKAFHKAKGDLDAFDYAEQKPLHKACTSNLSIVRLILGIEAGAGILVADSKRAPMLLASDKYGKECRILSALHGRWKIHVFCNEVIAENKEAVYNFNKTADDSAIEWTDEDFILVLKLIETENEDCLSYLMTRGFNLNTKQVDTNLTLPMFACKIGSVKMINFLMQNGLDFGGSLKDHEGKTAVHYAGACTKQEEALLAYLFTHEKRDVCKIEENILCMQDKYGKTPIHYSATINTKLNIDLVAPEGLTKAIGIKDENGMTPLLVSAFEFNPVPIREFITFDNSSVLDVDYNGHNALHLLFHSKRTNSRPIASELKAKLGLEGKQTKRERDANAQLLKDDIELVIDLVQAGCRLYKDHDRVVDADALLAISIEGIRDPSKLTGAPDEDRANFEAGDLMVQDMSLQLLNKIPEFLNTNDCWRLLVGCVRYCDSACKTFISLFEGGIADRLSGVLPIRKQFNKDTVSPLAKEAITYGGMTLVAWCIKMKNANALIRLVRKGYVMSLAADLEGNSPLHCIAKYGIASMVDTVLIDETVLIEALNRKGNTAMMEAAKSGNIKVAKRLTALHASARRGLEGMYAAWLLVFARRQEINQINTQTGRIGEDDASYFPAPNIGWYDDAMFSYSNAQSKKM